MVCKNPINPQSTPYATGRNQFTDHLSFSISTGEKARFMGRLPPACRLRLDANRQRIASFFPTAHRFALGKLDPTAHRFVSSGHLLPVGPVVSFSSPTCLKLGDRQMEIYPDLDHPLVSEHSLKRVAVDEISRS